MKFWNIASVGEDEAEITLYGEIVTRRPYNWIIDAPDDGLWITPQDFLTDLEAVRGKSRLLIRINSVGGDLCTSLGIYTQLKDLPAVKTVIIDGIAASSASVIAMAGDVVQIPPGGSIMIHEAAMQLDGCFQAGGLKLAERRLDAANDMAAQTYHAKTGLAVDAIRALMAKETWMTGQQAVDMKFADEVTGGASPAMSLSADRGTLTVNGVAFSTGGLKALPEGIPAAPAGAASTQNVPAGTGPAASAATAGRAGEPPAGGGGAKTTTPAHSRHPSTEGNGTGGGPGDGGGAGAPFPVRAAPQAQRDFLSAPERAHGTLNQTSAPQGAARNNNQHEEDFILKTAEDFKLAYPDLYAQVTTQAQGAERERIKAIDAIAAAVGDPELLEAAKFGDKPMNAEALALAALTKQAAQGAEFMGSAAADYAAGGAGGVKPTGGATGAAGGEPDAPLTPAQRMAQGAADGKALMDNG